MTSTYQARLVTARLSREAHVEAFGSSAQTQVQYCKERGLNATTFSGWLRSVRAAAQSDEKDEIEQSVPDVVKREGVRANAPLTALAVRIEAAASIATTNTPTARSLSAPACPTLVVRGRGGWCIDIEATVPACAAVASLLHALDRAEGQTQTHTHTQTQTPTAPAATPTTHPPPGHRDEWHRSRTHSVTARQSA